jgi:hypothetical protein
LCVGNTAFFAAKNPQKAKASRKEVKRDTANIRG